MAFYKHLIRHRLATERVHCWTAQTFGVDYIAHPRPRWNVDKFQRRQCPCFCINGQFLKRKVLSMISPSARYPEHCRTCQKSCLGHLHKKEVGDPEARPIAESYSCIPEHLQRSAPACWPSRSWRCCHSRDYCQDLYRSLILQNTDHEGSSMPFQTVVSRHLHLSIALARGWNSRTISQSYWTSLLSRSGSRYTNTPDRWPFFSGFTKPRLRRSRKPGGWPGSNP